MLAVLAAALVPGFSRMLQPSQAWGALCQAPATDGTSPAGHEHGDACVLCTLAHTTPTLAGTPPAATPILAYVPPAPPVAAGVRTRAARALAPPARGPPSAGPILPA